MGQEMSLHTIGIPLGSLDAYISQVNQIPILSLEEETDCAYRFHQQGDIEAARRLVLAHLRYVVRVAKGYLGYGLPLGDLIQEGSVGLMKAVKRFDPSLGVRLVSFAVHWIKAEIHEYVLRNWRIVKIATTKAKRKLFFNLRQMKKRLGWSSPEEVQAIAADLGVSPKDVWAMEECLNTMDPSFDAPDDDDEEQFAPASYLHNPQDDPAYVLEKEDSGEQGHDKLTSAMAHLDARSRDILQQRWLQEKPLTLGDLAQKYSISAERVRQLEKIAMQKIRTYLDQ